LDSTDGWERKLLYYAFAAALVLRTRILQDVQKLLTSLPPKIPHGADYFPAISKLPKWQASEFIHFQLKAPYNWLPNRLLYTADMMGLDSMRQTILVKFVRSYSIGLHHFCARLGHAPKILAFGVLPGGWLAIAMELIESAVPITASIRLPVQRILSHCLDKSLNWCSSRHSCVVSVLRRKNKLSRRPS
jgi:hypothetical protein